MFPTGPPEESFRPPETTPTDNVFHEPSLLSSTLIVQPEWAQEQRCGEDALEDFDDP